MKQSQKRVVLRTLLFSLLIIAVTFTTLFAGDLLGGEIIPKVYPQGVPNPPGGLRGLTVRTQDNADFPSEPNLSAHELQRQLEEIVSFAETYGYNAIFFEAVPECDALYRSSLLPSSAFWTGKQGAFTFFDPLGCLTNIAKERNIQIYATIDPFGVASGGLSESSPALKNPDWMRDGHLDPASAEVQKFLGRVAGELTERYDIAGVLLGNVDTAPYNSDESYADSIAKLTGQMHDAIRHKDVQRLGMVAGASGGRTLAAAPLRGGDLDFVTAPLADTSAEALPGLLAGWNELCAQAAHGGHTPVFYPLQSEDDRSISDHAADNILYFGRGAGLEGIVISNYGSLNTTARTAAWSLAASFAQAEPVRMPDLGYSRSFAVTRPADSLTVAAAAYYITGTSDPSRPVLFEGEPVESQTDTGLWGKLVEVPYGTTAYAFTQGGVQRTATLTRDQPPAVTLIDTIVKSSVYPANPEAVLGGTELRLSCAAPSGGAVTASIGGLTAELTPAGSASQNGVQTVYQGSLDLSSLALSGQVKKLGPVTYRLNYAGMNSSQQSAGEVYLAGEGAEPVVRMKTFAVPVNRNPADDGEYATVLKQDCVDIVTENAGGPYYRLSSGGHVLKSAVEVLEGDASATDTVSSMTLEKTAKGEKLRLAGTARPAFDGAFADGVVTIRLYNLAGFENMDTNRLESTLCSKIGSSLGDDGTVTFTFRLNDGVRLLGWDVRFEGNDAILYLKKMPVLHTDTAKPLSDVTVVLDPGHGGGDPGALGVPAENGPVEKTLNLANSYALESRLTALGATVHIVQEDESMTLNARMEAAQNYDADVFLSSHHNSLSETADSDTVAGIEVYYYNGQSADFAEQIGSGLSAATGRKLRYVQQSWYRVTMTTACPAVLVESGYICSPAEYEQLATDYQMFLYGNAVSDAVLSIFA